MYVDVALVHTLQTYPTRIVDPEMSELTVLHAMNLQRGGGGAGVAAATTMRILRDRGINIHTFVRDSKDIAPSFMGRLQAFSSGIYAYQSVVDFGRQLDKLKPDLVHVHELYPLISPWILRECTKRNVPAVMSAYDFRLSCPIHSHFYAGAVCTRCIDTSEWACIRQNCRGHFTESFAYAARNAVARHFDLFRQNIAIFITPTDFSARWLSQHADIDPERIRAITCAVDIPPSPTDPALGAYAAFAGRRVAEKGIDVVVAAARLAKIPLKLAMGAADDISDCHNDAQITYIQTRSRGELMNFFRNARFLVVPSIWFETGPLVVSEAMGHGLPVIASRIGALEQMVEHNRTGLLFETGNVNELALQMKRLWEDDLLCRRLGLAAREHALNSASALIHGNAVLRVYADVLGGRGIA